MLRTILAAALVLALPLAAQTKVFRVDTTHTKVAFKASTPLFDVPGQFTRYRVDVQGDPATLAGAQVKVEVEAGSVDTQNRTRDEHLRTPDFFDAARFPRITFVSDKVWQEGDKVVVHGTLTLHGVSREVTLPFAAAQGLNGAGVPTWSYRAAVPLNRLEYGIGAESVAAKISLRNTVEMELLLVGFFEDPQAEAPKAKAKAKAKPTKR